ncbi:MAG: hypothetical protein JSV82_01020 [Planctomycetota bacterium]|nr:MAG: hypothetical protein JSV82_01020 [Planctomycetota bacterium]
MKLIKRLVYGRFSKAEYKQLSKILSEETEVLLNRPQYIIGNLIIAGLIFYFIARAFSPDTYAWPSIAHIVKAVPIATVGSAIGVFATWLIFKLFKVKELFPKGFISFLLLPLLFFMTLFVLLVHGQNDSAVKWEFLLYAMLTLIGWLCCCNSIKKCLSERIFESQNKEPEGDG